MAQDHEILVYYHGAMYVQLVLQNQYLRWVFVIWDGGPVHKYTKGIEIQGITVLSFVQIMHFSNFSEVPIRLLNMLVFMVSSLFLRGFYFIFFIFLNFVF